MDEQTRRFLKRDRMRFTLNGLSSGLALLAIVFNVFYFVSIYKSNFNFYYNFDMGISVLLNLVFMLTVFLSSEGVKNYKQGYAIALIVVGALEIVRIFGLPLSAHNTAITLKVDGVDTSVLVMQDGQFARVIIYLVCTATLLITAGVIGIIRSRQLEEHKRSLQAKVVSEE